MRDQLKAEKRVPKGLDGYPIVPVEVYAGKQIYISQLHLGYEYAAPGVFDGWRWASNHEQAAQWAREDIDTSGKEHLWRQTHVDSKGTIGVEHEHQIKRKRASDLYTPGNRFIEFLAYWGIIKQLNSGIGFTPANGYLNRALRGTTFSDPTTLFCALFTATPSDSGGGTEVSGGSYARLSVACSSANWNAASNGLSASAAAFTFATATASWGTISQSAFFDAATVGNIYPWSDLQNTKPIGVGDVGTFATGAFSIGLS